MILTPERKRYIDGLSHHTLLERVRFGPIGDPWFQGETGEYWMKRLAEKQQASPVDHTAASKAIGWDR